MRKNKWLLPKIMIYFAFVAINLSCEKEEFKEQNLFNNYINLFVVFLSE